MNEELRKPSSIDSYSSSTNTVGATISILVILHWFTGLLFIPYIVLFFSETIYYTTGFILITFLSYIKVGIMLSAIPTFFLLGVAIWKVRSWAWKTSVIANAIYLILTIFGQIIFPAILNIVLLLILNSSDVKNELQT